MKRKIIVIDEERCNGCELCVRACHEGAIGMMDGKARLLRYDYCYGFGDCLPVCPTNAICFEEREALAYDETAVKVHMDSTIPLAPLPCGCPGTNSKIIVHEKNTDIQSASKDISISDLANWPIQIRLVPVNAPYFEGANLLIAADCTAFSYGNFHKEFIRRHITLIGCPKLDKTEYSDKLTEILKTNNIRSITVIRMEVPCCCGLENSVKQAVQNSGRLIPWQVHVISVSGETLD